VGGESFFLEKKTKIIVLQWHGSCTVFNSCANLSFAPFITTNNSFNYFYFWIIIIILSYAIINFVWLEIPIIFHAELRKKNNFFCCCVYVSVGDIFLDCSCGNFLFFGRKEKIIVSFVFSRRSLSNEKEEKKITKKNLRF
jgi:hypothetical protein